MNCIAPTLFIVKLFVGRRRKSLPPRPPSQEKTLRKRVAAPWFPEEVLQGEAQKEGHMMPKIEYSGALWATVPKRRPT